MTKPIVEHGKNAELLNLTYQGTEIMAQLWKYALALYQGGGDPNAPIVTSRDVLLTPTLKSSPVPGPVTDGTGESPEPKVNADPGSGQPITAKPKNTYLLAAACGLREWAQHRDCEAPTYWTYLADRLEARYNA